MRRFAEHAHVVGAPHVRLFVSTPLTASSGACIGCLCAPFSPSICCDIYSGMWCGCSDCLCVRAALAAPYATPPWVTILHASAPHAQFPPPDARALVPRVVLDMAPRPDGLKEAELKTLREMASMVTKRLEADLAAAARARAKDELLRSLEFVRAPFALCTLAPDRRLKIRYANSSWAWEAGALRTPQPRPLACLQTAGTLLLAGAPGARLRQSARRPSSGSLAMTAWACPTRYTSSLRRPTAHADSACTSQTSAYACVLHLR